MYNTMSATQTDRVATVQTQPCVRGNATAAAADIAPCVRLCTAPMVDWFTTVGVLDQDTADPHTDRSRVNVVVS